MGNTGLSEHVIICISISRSLSVDFFPFRKGYDTVSQPVSIIWILICWLHFLGPISAIDVQDIAIPILHSNIGDKSHPPCPAHQEDAYVGVITEDADCLGSVCRRLQHVTT